jgi:hypothetical protein
VTDGWSNTRNDHIVNFVAVFPNNPIESIILYAVSVKEQSQIGQNISASIEAAVLKTGFDKVAGIVPNNASNLQTAWKILERDHPRLICNGCTAHTFNLLVKDVCQLEQYASSIATCRAITTFVKTGTAVVTRFRKIQRKIKRTS